MDWHLEATRMFISILRSTRNGTWNNNYEKALLKRFEAMKILRTEPEGLQLNTPRTHNQKIGHKERGSDKCAHVSANCSRSSVLRDKSSISQR